MARATLHYGDMDISLHGDDDFLFMLRRWRHTRRRGWLLLHLSLLQAEQE